MGRREWTANASARAVWVLALPVLGQNLLAMFVGWSDTILTGRILVEEQYLAAITVGGYLLWLMECIAAVVWTGSQAIVARLIGADRIDEASDIVLQSMMLAVALGILIAVATLVWADPVITWMRLTGPAHGLAVTYLRTVAMSAPLMTVMLVGNTCLRAAGHTLAGMWIVTAVNIINVFLSWTLTLGIGPIPALGWMGIALGTFFSFVVGGALSFGWLLIGCGELRLPRHRPALDFRAFRRILRIGVPGAANSLAVVLCQLWFLSIIADLGAANVAAHGVAIRCESISWLSGEAFGIAAATLVGQCLGAGRPDLSRRYGWLAFRIGAYSMSVMGVAFYFGADWLVALFVDSKQADVFRLATPLLRLVAFSMPALAASLILTNALRGAGETRLPFLYNSAGLLLVRIPLAYAFTGTWIALGIYGAWIAMLIDLYVRGGASIAAFRSDRWSKLRV